MPEKKPIEVKMFSWFDDHFYKVRWINEAKQEVEEYFPSVTTKLSALDKPFLRRWYGQVGLEEALRVMREAADRGSRIHWAWQTYLLGGAVIYDPDKAAPYDGEELAELKKYHNNQYVIIRNQDEMYQMDKLRRWNENVKPVEMRCEQIVFDIDEKDAGTLDNLLLIEEGSYMIAGSKPLKLEAGWYVGDLKTGSSVSDTHKMQVARYSKMVEKMYAKDKHPIKIKGGLIIHTSSTTKNGIEGLQTIHIDEKQLDSYNQDYLDIAKVWNRNCSGRKPKIRQLPALIKK